MNSAEFSSSDHKTESEHEKLLNFDFNTKHVVTLRQPPASVTPAASSARHTSTVKRQRVCFECQDLHKPPTGFMKVTTDFPSDKITS